MGKRIEINYYQICRDLESGVTRYKKDDAGCGSIEEKYGMTPQQVEIFFRHPKLKDLQTIPFPFVLVFNQDIQVNTELFEEPPASFADYSEMASSSKETVKGSGTLPSTSINEGDLSLPFL